MRKLRIAFEGCCHGELDKIYRQIEWVEAKTSEKVDLLIICGDFQAVRNAFDLSCLACPPKYRQMGDFQDYYFGRKRAPIPTLFIGGNHEASNHLWELYYGGWVAPNIYYLGQSSVLWFKGLRIGGISGIYYPADYSRPYYETLPYHSSSIRSIYHTRHYEIQKLLALGLSPHFKATTKPLDIFVSHDWPQSIYYSGNLQKLLRIKPFFKQEIDRHQLGSPPLKDILSSLKPKFWASAHLHVKFVAKKSHTSSNHIPSLEDLNALEREFNQFIARPWAIDMLKETRDDEAETSETLFLALDKCLPRRSFLQVKPSFARLPFLLELPIGCRI